MTLTHTVGNGGTHKTVVRERVVYALFGTVPLKKFDSKTLANGATDYTIQSKFTFTDLLIAIPAIFITFHTQTVYVSY